MMFLFNLRNNKRGMTLVEMIVSLVILSILMTSTMGMITSSMNIFTATSKAAIDRMVGNSVYSTVLSTLRFATNVRITDTPDTKTNLKAFWINGETEPETVSGPLMFRGENSADFVSLYDPNFYKGRTVQYSIHKASKLGQLGSDQRHLKISIKIFRDGKAVFSKNAIIKCINIDLVKSSGNAIQDSSAPESVNQYIYFSAEDLLAAGGEAAWSTEYKMQSFINSYNRILSRYTHDFDAANNELNSIAHDNTNEDGHRVLASKLSTVVAERDRALFGPGEPKAGDNPCNLREFYSREMEELLGFEPTKAGLTASPRAGMPHGNPYAGIVATKEELYLGFMLKYFDENEDGVISQKEYPHFTQDGFFDNTIFSQKNYMTQGNEMKILCYCRDDCYDIHNRRDDAYQNICTSEGKTLYTYVGQTDSYTVEQVSDFAGGGANDTIKNFIRGRLGLSVTTDIKPYSAETLAAQDEENLFCDLSANKKREDADKYPGKKGGYRYTFKYTGDPKADLSAAAAGGRAGAVFGSYDKKWKEDYWCTGKDDEEWSDTWRSSDQYAEKMIPLLNAQPLSFTANDSVGTAKFEGTPGDVKTYECDAPYDLAEGWYYWQKSAGKLFKPNNHTAPYQSKYKINAYHYYFFYLEGRHDLSQDELVKAGLIKFEDGGNRVVAVKSGSTISLLINSADSDDQGNYARFISYERALPGQKDLQVSQRDVVLYKHETPEGHQYKDFVLYGVDWNSWFRKSQKGLLNGLLSLVNSWFNDRADITSVEPSNAQDALGVKGTCSVEGWNNSARSYNLAWLVYSPYRGAWYYLPDNSNDIGLFFTNLGWSSVRNTSVPLDLFMWSCNSTNVVNDIEDNKLCGSTMFGLVKTRTDARWVPLPTPGEINRTAPAPPPAED